jgi:hypothetical protein
MSKDKTGNWFGRHKILSGIGVLIVIGIIASAAGGSKSTTTTSKGSSPTASTSSTKSSTASLAKINQPADDGKLQFTVTGIQCNQSQVEDPSDTDVATTAGAPYCIVSLNVKNIQTVAQTFDSSSQYLYDATNKQYSVDSGATITLNPESSNFMEDPTVNPGVSISGQLVYDIPSTITPAYAILHDSSLSSGVKVGLQ